MPGPSCCTGIGKFLRTHITTETAIFAAKSTPSVQTISLFRESIMTVVLTPKNEFSGRVKIFGWRYPCRRQNIKDTLARDIPDDRPGLEISRFAELSQYL